MVLPSWSHRDCHFVANAHACLQQHSRLCPSGKSHFFYPSAFLVFRIEDLIINFLSLASRSASSDSSVRSACSAELRFPFLPIPSMLWAAATAVWAAKLPTAPFNACAARATPPASPLRIACFISARRWG